MSGLKTIDIPVLDKNITYKTDSNLGGVFKLKFLSYDAKTGVYHFQNISPGFENWQHQVKPSELNDFLIQ